MSAAAPAGLAPALAAVRARLALIGLLLALAAVAWWWTADRMQGMDQGPGTPPGALGWFVGVWVVMMAAMMLPSVAPTVALHARMTRTRAPWAPLAFTAGYLLTWSGAGLLAYGVFTAGRELAESELAWDGAGRWVAGSTLLLAAVYELTPLKDACLSKCRSPLGFLLGRWRDGPRGALGMGVRHGAWCLGCCWALMASLFALGVMSIAAMAFVAALIAFEKTVPWERAATWTAAALLVALGVLLIAAPEAVPGLTIPAEGGMEAMP
jgi:predicted metal-binding membrane protein